MSQMVDNPLNGLPANLHVPLTVGMTLAEALVLWNAFYLMDLKPTQFKDAQAILGSDGYVTLDLMNPTGDTLWYRFVNTMVVQSDTGPVKVFNSVFVFQNPLDLLSDHNPLMATPVTIGHLEELDFLKALPAGFVLNIADFTSSLPFQLATLLNQYNVLGKWSSGSMGEYATAGFSLLYFGKAVDAPDEYLLPDTADTVVLIKINHGDNQGVLCLQYLTP